VIPASVENVWNTLTEIPFSWSKWWPELSDVKHVVTNKEIVGSQITCVWRTPYGYSVKCKFTATESAKYQRVVFVSEGDLYGTATWVLHGIRGGTKIDIEWDVRTRKLWMNLLGVLIQPVFIANHAKIMTSGEVGLIKYLHESGLEENQT
jgi:hypothetical protein